MVASLLYKKGAIMKHPSLNYVRPDSRNRITLTKITKKLAPFYKVTVVRNKIILEPIRTVPESMHWLLEPGNEQILAELKASLKQKATINRGSFKKYLDDDDGDE